MLAEDPDDVHDYYDDCDFIPVINSFIFFSFLFSFVFEAGVYSDSFLYNDI